MTASARPHVTLCMATSLDGKISQAYGETPAFTSRFDREKLFRLRAETQALLVGANTVRHEKLPPLVRNEALQEARQAQGLGKHPDVFLVSGSMQLPWGDDYFAKAQQDIYVVTGKAPSDTLDKAEEAQVKVLQTGPPLDLNLALQKIYALGYTKILCEGGGTLVRGMLAQNLIDTLHLTLAATAIGGETTPGLVAGAALKPRPEFTLLEHHAVGSELHLVYGRQQPEHFNE